jgi:nucleoside-diphosphate-sugar epimerase
MVEIMNKRTVSPLTIVTGGAGFLGSHICDRLVAEGHEVPCLDNLLTGRIENIQHLWDHPRFVFVLQDVTNPIKTQIGAFHGSPAQVTEIQGPGVGQAL